MKHPLIERDEYIITGEFVWFGVILHSEVYRWGSKIRKQYRKDLNELIRFYNQKCYSVVGPRDEQRKLPKFINSVGGFKHHRRKNYLGEWVEVYHFPLSLF